MFPFREDASKRYDDYRITMGKVADYVVQNKSAIPVFIPMVSIPNKPLEQDDEASQDVISAMRHREMAKAIRSNYSPREIQGLIGAMKLQIGTRMHSVIFASSMNVPVIAVAYEPKTTSLMNTLGLDQFVFGIETLNFQEVVRSVDTLWKDRQKWMHIAARNTKALRQMASESGSAVASLCESLANPV